MKNEIKLIDYEIIGSLLFIGTLFISVILSYNEKLRLEKKEPLFDNNTQKNILIVNADFKVTTYKLKKKGVSVICISDDKISNSQKYDCLIYKIENNNLKKLNKLFDEKNYNIIKLDDKIFVIEKK